MDGDRLTQLPMSRIRTVMKTSPDMGIINADALFLMCRAAEMFIEHMAKGAHREGRKTLDYKALARFVEKEDNLEFLQQILPKKISVKEYKAMMEKKPNTDDDTESEGEEESDQGDQGDDDDEVVEIVDDDEKEKAPTAEDSEDTASDSGESNSVISIESSSDEKENSKNVSNKKSPVKHKTR